MLMVSAHYSECAKKINGRKMYVQVKQAYKNNLYICRKMLSHIYIVNLLKGPNETQGLMEDRL